MSAAHDLFFLAHYAYNILNPLVDEAKAIEPSTQLSIFTSFGHAEAVYQKRHQISVEIHWGREGMLGLFSGMTHKTDVDAFAATLRAKVDKLILSDAVEEKRNPWTEVLAPLASL